ncbi:unnamed protein product, partial [Ectocarpus sp. 8 AP-2014]
MSGAKRQKRDDSTNSDTGGACPGVDRSRWLDALVVALDQAYGGRRQWYTSTKELQLTSLGVCRACRNVPTLHLQIKDGIPGRLLSLGGSSPGVPRFSGDGSSPHVPRFSSGGSFSSVPWFSSDGSSASVPRLSSGGTSSGVPRFSSDGSSSSVPR